MMMGQTKILKGIRALMRAHWDIPSDVTEAKLDEHAARILREAQQGDSLEVVEFSLSQIQTNKLRLPYTKESTRKLAKGVIDLARVCAEPVTQAGLN